MTIPLLDYLSQNKVKEIGTFRMHLNAKESWFSGVTEHHFFGEDMG